MNNDLIERYIYAATRRLPAKQRDDVAAELRGLVDDMLTERCGDVTPTEKDIRVVLTELGTPQELYAQYAEDAKKCLIGQPYYSTYKSVLKIVMVSIAVGVTLANIQLQLLEPQEWYAAILRWLGMLYNCALAGFTIVTLLFAFFYRRGTKISEPFNFDDLPPVPKRKQKISKWECIAGIVLSVVFVVLMLLVPQIFGFTVDGDGVFTPMFDVDALRGTWYIIIAFAACGIVRESVQLFEGRYNRRVLVVAVVTNVISAALAIWWLAGFELMNPDFLAKLPAIADSANDLVVNMFENLQIFLMIVILFALGIDTGEAAYKTLWR